MCFLGSYVTNTRNLFHFFYELLLNLKKKDDRNVKVSLDSPQILFMLKLFKHNLADISFSIFKMFKRDACNQ